jgi:aldehyde oxidoreductase
MNDTNLPNSGPAGGSRSNVFTGNATKMAAEMLLNAMRKPDGTYRTYAEMVAEKIPLAYDGKWVASDCTACRRGDLPGQSLPGLHVRVVHARS